MSTTLFGEQSLSSNLRRVTVVGCLAVLSSILCPTVFAAPGDENWDSRFTFPGADHLLNDFALYDSDLYAGGRFTVIGGVAASRIARWNGTNWSPVGSGVEGSATEVYAFLVSSNKLIVAGNFTSAGGIAATNIASWDGSQWHSMGNLRGGSVYALAELNGEIYAGGTFRTNSGAAADYIVRWNGSQWQAAGTGVNGIVYALEQMGNVLFLGGSFSQAGILSAPGIVRWNGLNYSPVGSGLDSGAAVYALSARGLNLYVGGAFNQAGGISSPRLALWDEGNSQWLSVGANGIVYGLHAALDILYVGGEFSMIGGTAVANRIAALTPTNWAAFGSGVSGAAFPRVEAVHPFNGSVFAGGVFDTAGGVSSPFVAEWDGAAWKAAGPTNGFGFNSVANAVALEGTNIHVFGSFSKAGEAPVTGAARWTGNGWQQMGSGLGALFLGRYYSLVDGTNLYVGGPGSVQQWNGSAWTPLGFGAAGPVALSGTNLYAVLSSFGPKFVGRWNGSSWEQLGTNFINNVGSLQPLIQGLVATGDVVYATGYFQKIGTNDALHVAKWDGNQWTGLGAGINPPGFSSSLELALLGNNLLVGTLCNFGTNRILRWNGSLWSTFPGTFTQSDFSSVWLQKILVVGNELYVGGRFTHVDGVKASGLAHWDGSQWRGFGSGLGGNVYDLAFGDGKVYAAGDFTSAGINGSGRFAIWSGATPAISALSLVPFGNTLRLTWPAELLNVLQGADNLSTPNWQTVSDPPITINGRKLLNIVPTNNSGFFRLN